MTEKYLHQLWQKKRFTKPELILSDGRSLRILHFGYYNRNNEGPDFSMAVIEIEGQTLYGPVELHVKSSDWYRHGHQNDNKYSQVILHVVYEHDQEVTLSDQKIPVLELRPYIDTFHYAKQLKGMASDQLIPCSGHLLKASSLDAMKEWAIQKRLSELKRETETTCQPLLSLLIARSFGMGENGKEWIGFLDNGTFSGNYIRFGLRPQNRVETRTVQLRVLLSTLKEFRAEESAYKEFNKVIDQVNIELRRSGVAEMGTVLRKNIFTNAILPYLYINQDLNLDQVLETMNKIAPESNYYTRIWKDKGFLVRSLFDSQGLLWLYKWKCSEKKCLTCTVGRETIYNDSKNSLLF